jgi:hypothetical protein
MVEKNITNTGVNIGGNVGNNTNVAGRDQNVAGRDQNVAGGNQTIISINQTTYNNLERDFKISLDEFLKLINEHSKTLSEDQKTSLKESIDSLAREAEGLKTGQVLQDQQKKDEIKSQQITLADKIVNYLPKVAESIALATPLAPFSKVIGEGTGYFAEWIRNKLSKKQPSA